MNNAKLLGRLRIIREMSASNKRFSVSVGSKNTRLADINVDIDVSCAPNVVADARYLPFKLETFDLTYFTDVVEHLPGGGEEYDLPEQILAAGYKQPRIDALIKHQEGYLTVRQTTKTKYYYGKAAGIYIKKDQKILRKN